MKRLLDVSIALLLLVTAGELGAAEVYRSIGPQGEVRFSDVETPGSEPVTVDAPEPARGEAGDWVAETLAVALILQDARLAREAAADRRAAERRAALRERSAAAPPPVAPAQRTTYAPWYPYPYPRPPHGGHRPGRPGHPPPWRPDRPSSPPAEPPPMKAPIPGADWAERN